jgi:hypothetical protein
VALLPKEKRQRRFFGCSGDQRVQSFWGKKLQMVELSYNNKKALGAKVLGAAV